jgi:hypothetical protein
MTHPSLDPFARFTPTAISPSASNKYLRWYRGHGSSNDILTCRGDPRLEPSADLFQSVDRSRLWIESRMVSRDVLHELVDSLPESEIATAERLLMMISKEPIGPEFADSIRRGLAQADAGDAVVCRDYSEMVEKALD